MTSSNFFDLQGAEIDTLPEFTLSPSPALRINSQMRFFAGGSKRGEGEGVTHNDKNGIFGLTPCMLDRE
jgi:hypothetical protein